MEAAGRLKALAFDKSGTLTEGRPVLARAVALEVRDEAEALALAAALERCSEHPLAHAILTAADGLDLPEIRNFVSVVGRDALAEVANAGETPVVLGDAAGPAAVFGLADAVRPEARSTLEALRATGIGELVMLTGDTEAPARRIADELGVGHKARLLPEQKVEAVRELVAEHGDAGMVGDGVNDAPALAASSVGFAMGAAGTDVALETADVALMQDDLPKLAEAVRLSRAAERIIKQNVAVSLLIKGLFVLLAPFGLVRLWLAVLADMRTSIAVTLNGLRLFNGGRKGR